MSDGPSTRLQKLSMAVRFRSVFFLSAFCFLAGRWLAIFSIKYITLPSGICINKNLKCNGDNDCGETDTSDEDECDVIRTPCGRTAVFESDIAIQAGYGSEPFVTYTNVNNVHTYSKVSHILFEKK